MQIKTIYFTGGGTLGMSFVGVIKALQEYNLLNNVETVIGTSIGSMIACSLTLNVPWKDLYKSFFDFNVTTCAHIEIDNILTKFGLDSGKKFMISFVKMLKKHAKKTNMTFKEHYELTKKKLIITAACVNDQTTHYFDYQRTPNLQIIRAVRMSISLPFYFTSPKYNRKHMVDGGTFETYPFQLFGDSATFLGIGLIRPGPTTFKPIKTIENFISNIISGSRNRITKIEKLFCNKNNYKFIDIISDGPVLDFDNKTSLKIRLFQNGYDEAKKYIIEQIINKKNDDNILLSQNDNRINSLENKLDLIIKLLQNNSVKSLNNIELIENNITEPQNINIIESQDNEPIKSIQKNIIQLQKTKSIEPVINSCKEKH